jgi:hypothetical protein
MLIFLTVWKRQRASSKLITYKPVLFVPNKKCVCPFVQISSSRPLYRKRVCPPPLEPKGDGQHSLADEGAERADSDDWKEILALCILCGHLPSQYGRYFAASEMLPGSLFHVGRNQKHNCEFYICSNYAAAPAEAPRRVTQQVWICTWWTVPCHLPWRTKPLAPVCGLIYY